MKLQLLILFLICSLTTFAQTTFSFGPELGINVSGIPRSNLGQDDRSDIAKRSSMPLVSPVAGAYVAGKFGKHFILSSGMIYRYKGRKEYSYYEHNSSTTENVHDQIFHTLSFPVQAGFNFKIRKKEIQINAGYNFNYFLSGQYHEQYIFTQEIGENTVTERFLDPFDKNDFDVPATRWNNQFLFTLDLSLNEKIDLSFSTALGWPVSYMNLYFDGDWCYQGYGYNYENFDISVSAKYNLGKKIQRN